MDSQRSRERGISIPPVLMVIGILLMMGMTFLAVVRFQVQRTGYEQATITAGYIAEIGFQQLRAELAALDGDWTQINGIVKDCATTDPFYTRCQRLPNTNSFTNFRRVRENPLDPNSRIIGIYEAAIETGEKRSIFGNKTLTGSAVGFVPGTTLSTEKKGYDQYGNELCDLDTNSCPGRFMGLKIKAWLTDAQGNLLAKGRSQEVYGVLQLNTGNLLDSPAGYLLESDKSLILDQSTTWNEEYHPPAPFAPYPGRDPDPSVYDPPLDCGATPFQETGAFYGPVHTNQQFNITFRSVYAPVLQSQVRGATANGSDLLKAKCAYPGVLQIEKGAQWNPFNTVTVYQPGQDFVYFPRGSYWQIDWSLGGIEPAPASTYTVDYTDGTPTSVNVVKGAANGLDAVPAYTPNGITAVRQGGTTYIRGVHFKLKSDSFVVWAVPDGGGGWLPGTSEPSSGTNYRVIYINHSPIRVYDRMSYSGAAPKYTYWQEHAMSSSYPLYQQGHAHTNIAGADLNANSTAVGADPGYDAASWRHWHNITNDLIGTPNPNYLSFANALYAPVNTAAHNSPLLKPTSAIANYKNQLEQLNKYLQLTLGISMPRNTDDSLNPSTLPSTSNFLYGYLVGSAVDNHLVYNLPAIDNDDKIVDFRSVYFGSKVKYSAGSQIGVEIPFSQPSAAVAADRYYAWIWVNDNPASADYMKVSDSQTSADYRMYRYVKIPENEVILVQDAVVLIGNREPNGLSSNCTALYADCLPLLNGNPPGRSTIVDGQVTIVSFTTSPPGPGLDYKYSKGDIVVVGDVVYKNTFYSQYNGGAAKMELRQLDPQPIAGYSHNHLTTTSITDPQTMWVTNPDGTVARDSTGAPVGKICGLGLFATHDVKLSVTGMRPDPAPDTTPNSGDDRLLLNAQMVAGNRVYVHSKNATGGEMTDQDLIDGNIFSYSDLFKFYGTIYSFEVPSFTLYFKQKRNYYYDRSLYMNPLMGAPAYPTTAGDYRNQAVYNNYPQLVQGSWKMGAR
jgi:hypothetical protein